MANDKKTIKFQMMMSPSEAEALDDWGFSRRIRSRAEAIRQLIQKGFTYDVAAKRADLGSTIIQIFLSGKFPPMELIADYIEQGEFEIESLKARNQLARKVSEELLTASILKENPELSEEDASSIARAQIELQAPRKGDKDAGDEVMPKEERLAMVTGIRKAVRAREEDLRETSSPKEDEPPAAPQKSTATKSKRVLKNRR